MVWSHSLCVVSERLISKEKEPDDIQRSLSQQLDRLVQASKTGNNSKNDKSIDADIPAPVVLSNGNYACSHACKDKSKCAHVCCKEGKSKPSAKEKMILQKNAVMRARQSANETFNRTSKSIVPLNESGSLTPHSASTKPKLSMSGMCTQNIIDLSLDATPEKTTVSKTCDMSTLMSLHSRSTPNIRGTLLSKLKSHLPSSREVSKTLTQSSDAGEEMPTISERVNDSREVTGGGMNACSAYDLDEYDLDMDDSIFQDLPDAYLQELQKRATSANVNDTILQGCPEVDQDVNSSKMAVSFESEERPMKRRKPLSQSKTVSIGDGHARVLRKTASPAFSLPEKSTPILEAWRMDKLFQDPELIIEPTKEKEISPAYKTDVRIASALAFLGDCCTIGDEADESANLPVRCEETSVRKATAQKSDVFRQLAPQELPSVGSNPAGLQAANSRVHLNPIPKNVLGLQKERGQQLLCFQSTKSLLKPQPRGNDVDCYSHPNATQEKENVRIASSQGRMKAGTESDRAFADLFAKSSW